MDTLPLTPSDRAKVARDFGCELHEVEQRLAERMAAMDRHAYERRDYEDPYGYGRTYFGRE
jgi:hypothetical protein